jgi:ADP-ribose pyrophosphatase YjhB (NUDIX family)/predicted transcriptional regulator
MTIKLLEEKNRASIIDRLSRKEYRFNDLAKVLCMKSNELSYHLNILSKAGYIIRDSSEKYMLTDQGKGLVPYLKFIRKEEIPPTIFCAPIVIKHGKALFVKRDKEPYKGFLEFPGGKVKRGETLVQAAMRELSEETGVIGKNGRVICIADILTSKANHFIGAYVKADFSRKKEKPGQKMIWIDLAKIEGQRIIADNKLVISRFLDNKTRYVQLFYDEEKNTAKIVK